MAGNSTNNQYPSVSLIMPVRNEVEYIQTTLQSIFNQDYPLDLMEVLVVDGMSTDDTRGEIRDFMRENPSLKIEILDNPRQIVPPALNLGIKHSSGEYILWMSGHSELPADYVSTVVKFLQRGDIQNVGGQVYPVGRTYLERAIAMAIRSPFFVGNSYFRYGEEERLVESVFPGAFPRGIFDEIGYFDEELVRHQDYEFNLRLRNAGGKILYLPTLRVKYFPRSSIRALLKQYYQYGIWKVRVMQKARGAFQVRHYAPTALVMGFIGASLLALFNPALRNYYAVGIGLYLLGTLVISSLVSWQNKTWKYLPVLPLLFSVIQFGWGSGFWWGTIKWNFLSRSNSDGKDTRE